MSSKPHQVPLRISAIPYTPPSRGGTSLRPRPLAPILPHPGLDTILAPPLPTPPRPWASVFHNTTHGVYHLSTHLIPAAYPRHTPDIPLPVLPAHTPGEVLSKRKSKIKELVEEVQARQDVFVQGKLGGKPSEKFLWNCVNRYVRTSAVAVTTDVGGGTRTGMTLFMAPPNGLHKETWETTIRALLDASAGAMVNEVWTWDAVHCGDSAIVNTKNQNGICDVLDNTRDIAKFLLYYLPEQVEATELPTHLQRLPVSVAKAREEHGYHARKLVVVGHSLGGCSSLRAAFDFPKLFSSFVLVDPFIYNPNICRPGYLHSIAIGAFARRDRWSSRGEAHQWFKKSLLFSAWHPEVLQHYVDYALVDDGEGRVTLKMTALQEGLTLANSLLPGEIWVLLERLDERITLRWIVSGIPIIGGEKTSETVWRRPANSSNVMFHSIGHLITQETPYELAHDISDFLVRKYGCAKAHL